MNGLTIIDEAKKYLGQHEKKGNSGFENPAFETEMREEGWQTGWAWCCVFVRVVLVNWAQEFIEKKVQEFRKLITPSVRQTYINLRDAGYLMGNIPQVGCVVVYLSFKDGKETGTGHIGFVSAITPAGNGNYIYEDISGNTNESGSREGVMVGAKSHRFDKESLNTQNGLRPVAFIQIV